MHWCFGRASDAVSLRPVGHAGGTMTVVEITDQQSWDAVVGALPGGHPLQLWAWGEVKRLNGWTPHRLALLRAGVPVAAGQLLLWRLPAWRRAIAYLPRGPLGPRREAAAFLRVAATFARARGALCLRVEPAWTGQPPPPPWRPAPDRILVPHTYTIDLARDDGALWAALRSKTRQYIRRAEAEGVVVERDANGILLPDVRRIYATVAARAGFALHADAYYQRAFAAFGPHTRLYGALVEGRPEAFLWVVEGGGVAFAEDKLIASRPRRVLGVIAQHAAEIEGGGHIRGGQRTGGMAGRRRTRRCSTSSTQRFATSARWHPTCRCPTSCRPDRDTGAWR